MGFGGVQALNGTGLSHSAADIYGSKNRGKKLAAPLLHTSQQLLVLSLNSTLRKIFLMEKVDWTASAMLNAILSPLLFVWSRNNTFHFTCRFCQKLF